MLVCAVCLYEIRTNQGRFMPEYATTIANGQAVCTDHFISIHNKRDQADGTVALVSLKKPETNA